MRANSPRQRGAIDFVIVLALVAVIGYVLYTVVLQPRWMNNRPGVYCSPTSGRCAGAA